MSPIKYCYVGFVACVISGCQTFSLDPEPLLQGPKDKLRVAATIHCDQVDPTSSDYDRFLRAAYCAQRDDAAAKKHLAVFVTDGTAIADQFCKVLFQALETRRRNATYSQNNLNVGATAVTALLAKLGGHTQAIFNLATTLTASNAIFENYKANFVLSPEIQAVHDQIKIMRQQKREEMLSKQYADYGDARRDLLNYDDLCSAANIKKIVSDSVRFAKFTFDPINQPSEADIKMAKSVIKQIYEKASGLKNATFPDDDFYLLYLAVTHRDEEVLYNYLVNGNQTFDKYLKTLFGDPIPDKDKWNVETLSLFDHVRKLLRLDTILAAKLKGIREAAGKQANYNAALKAFNAVKQNQGVAKKIKDDLSQRAESLKLEWQNAEKRVSDLNLSNSLTSNPTGQINFNFRAVQPQ